MQSQLLFRHMYVCSSNGDCLTLVFSYLPPPPFGIRASGFGVLCLRFHTVHLAGLTQSFDSLRLPKLRYGWVSSGTQALGW